MPILLHASKYKRASHIIVRHNYDNVLHENLRLVINFSVPLGVLETRDSLRLP